MAQAELQESARMLVVPGTVVTNRAAFEPNSNRFAGT
jgi:hypothetical protein